MNSPVSMFLQKYNRFAESKAEKKRLWGEAPRALVLLVHLEKKA